MGERWRRLVEKAEAETGRARDDRAAREQQRTVRNLEAGKAVNTPISDVGRTGGAGLACPRCGGMQFKQRRSRGGRVAVVTTGVIGLAVTKQKQVQCVTCGARYQRG